MKNTREIVCKNFNRLLTASGFKQVEVAKSLCVSTATVQNWVKGKSSPTIENLDAIGALFKVDTAEFFQTSAAPQIDSKIDDLMAQLQAFKQPQQNIATLDPELQALFDRAAAIPRERRKAMMEGMEECIEACENKLAREAQLTNIKKNA